MGWIADLIGRTIALDSAPLIYYIEEHQDFGKVLDPFFEAVGDGQIALVTSTVTLLEVLVHPIQHKDEALAHKYNDVLLTSPNIKTIPVTPMIAQASVSQWRCKRQTGAMTTPKAFHTVAQGRRAAAHPGLLSA